VKAQQHALNDIVKYISKLTPDIEVFPDSEDRLNSCAQSPAAYMCDVDVVQLLNNLRIGVQLHCSTERTETQNGRLIGNRVN